MHQAAALSEALHCTAIHFENLTFLTGFVIGFGVVIHTHTHASMHTHIHTTFLATYNSVA